MTDLIVAFGALIFLAGVAIALKPEVFFGYLRRHLDNPALQVLAVVVRLVIGALLVLESDLSRYPLVIMVLGWLSIVAAFSFAVMGRRNFLRLMSWTLNSLGPYGRVGGVFAAAFGGFLVHAFI